MCGFLDITSTAEDAKVCQGAQRKTPFTTESTKSERFLTLERRMSTEPAYVISRMMLPVCLCRGGTHAVLLAHTFDPVALGSGILEFSSLHGPAQLSGASRNREEHRGHRTDIANKKLDGSIALLLRRKQFLLLCNQLAPLCRGHGEDVFCFLGQLGED